MLSLIKTPQRPAKKNNVLVMPIPFPFTYYEVLINPCPSIKTSCGLSTGRQLDCHDVWPQALRDYGENNFRHHPE